MTEICQNAKNWYSTTRGQAPHPASQIGNSTFGYDFNTGKSSSRRSTMRRRASCPGTWKNGHSCPELVPPSIKPMRNDKEWYYADLEPLTSINQIRNFRFLGTVVEYSKIRYTCDEFPPATWVEGGNGFGGAGTSQTRCAAMRCSPGVKSEQDCTQF
jgi:hypothetical protein